MNKTLEWLYRAEQPHGGIAAWQLSGGAYHSSYVEVSGYLIPSLIKWGAGDLAIRCANWLLTVQNSDSSFTGLDGVPRPFDTSAVIEGLEAIYKATGTAIYRAAANVATDWMRTQISNDGYLYNSPGNHAPNLYNLRASAIIGNYAEVDYWRGRPLIVGRERSHYLAYALEGLLNFGAREIAMPYIELAYSRGYLLQSFYVDEDWRPLFNDWDICSSAQMALLFKRVGLDVERHYQAIQKQIKPDGGVPQSNSDDRSLSWGAKFYLDLVYEMEGK